MEEFQNIPVREKAYIYLRNAIVKGTMQPGQRIVEDVLVAQFSVSRTPLREAIHKLEQDGLLVRAEGRGLMVSRMSEKEITELYEVREYLEALATKRATENLTDERKETLIKLKQQLINLYNKGEGFQLSDLFREHHKFIITCSEHSVCMEFLDKMNTKIARYAHVSFSTEERQEQAFSEHVKIMELMLAGEAEQAEAAMRMHIANSLCSFKENFNKETLEYN